jgi:hypothetical protein
MCIRGITAKGRKQLWHLLNDPGLEDRLLAEESHQINQARIDIQHFIKRGIDPKPQCLDGCTETVGTNHLWIHPRCAKCGNVLPNLRSYILKKWKMAYDWYQIGPKDGDV